MRNKAFTLIELLVVIAIIGLLASIVVVNVNSARDKAKTTKAVAFSQQIYRALGADAVGAWNFSDNVNDISGSGNNGTIVGNPAYVASLTFSGGNLSFDGNDYVSLGNNASLKTAGKGGKLTVEAWVYLNSSSNDFAIYHSQPGRRISLRSNAFTVQEPGQAPAETNFLAPSAGTWHHYVGVYDSSLSSGNVKAYLDGSPIGTPQSYTRSLGDATANFIATADGASWFMAGRIDEVRIYDQSLGLSEIQKLYAEGLPRHQLVQK